MARSSGYFLPNRGYIKGQGIYILHREFGPLRPLKHLKLRLRVEGLGFRV